MNTLYSSPFNRVLNRLTSVLADTDWVNRFFLPQLAARRESQMIREKLNLHRLQATLRDQTRISSREAASLIYMLVRVSGAEVAVEFGCSFGISTLHLAAAISDNGGGFLIATEIDRSKIEQIQNNIDEAGLSEFVEIREGNAQLTLSSDMPLKIDLLLLNGEKSSYLDILKLVENRLSPRALIVGNEANNCPEYLEYVRSMKNGYLSLPLSGGIELSIRT